jgi:hypothetical protein
MSCTASSRLCRDISLIKFDCLSVVFTSIEVHLWLDLKDEVSRIPAEGLRPEFILLHID